MLLFLSIVFYFLFGCMELMYDRRGGRVAGMAGHTELFEP